MYIKTIEEQHRRDFTAIYKCEACNYEMSGGGYDDRYFHDKVMPNKKCPKCEKSRNDLGLEQPKTETRYPEGYQI